MRGAALLLLLGTGACGFTPIYGSAGGDSVGSRIAQIRVGPVSDISKDAYARDYYRQGRSTRLAQLFQDGLERQMTGNSGAPYMLQTTIEERIEGFGIRPDESFTRQRVSLIVRYELHDATRDRTIFRGEAKSEVGVDRVRSEYATLVAERTASERNAQQLVRQITAKLALVLRGDLKGEDGLSEPAAPSVSGPGADPLPAPTTAPAEAGSGRTP